MMRVNNMAKNMKDDLKEILVTEEAIRERVKELGKQISADYADKDVIFVGILKGCYVFMADLLRSVEIYCDMDFMAVSSYGNGTSSTGAVRITKDLNKDIEGKHLIIVEDILDSGITLGYLKGYLASRNPASIKIVTLLDKPKRRKNNITADYFGFTVPDEFVVGYGLDYAERYRNLPYIAVLKPEVYEN